jgi:large subunit ribosomal protein L15
VEKREIRMKKRIKRIRGTRTCGGGSHKKRRGKGSKGGSGNAGAYEHHFVRSLKMGIRKGKHKSQLPLQNRAAKRFDQTFLKSLTDKAVNVGELEAMLEELIEIGKAEEKADGSGIYLDATQLGIEKILGKGKVTRKLTLRANKISRAAKEKIERAGGEVKEEVEVEVASGV